VLGHEFTNVESPVSQQVQMQDAGSQFNAPVTVSDGPMRHQAMSGAMQGSQLLAGTTS
jgi:hypothetical protein